MFNSLKALILAKKYKTKAEAMTRVEKAYPKYTTVVQYYELSGLCDEVYGKDDAAEDEA